MPNDAVERGLGAFRSLKGRFLRFCGLGFYERKNKATMPDKKRCGRGYDREFKQNAVALVLNGRSQSEVSRDLGVSLWSLGEWVKKARAGQVPAESATLAAETAEQRELRRLRQENAYLRQQRDILKKALGILSAEMPSNASR